MSAIDPDMEGGCTVAELIAHLLTFPPEMRVLYQAYSDWNVLTVDEVTVTKAIPKDHYVMRFHDSQYDTLTPEEQQAIRTFVAFPRN